MKYRICIDFFILVQGKVLGQVNINFYLALNIILFVCLVLNDTSMGPCWVRQAWYFHTPFLGACISGQGQ